MKPERWRATQDLFDRCASLPAVDRKSFLAGCDASQDVKDEVLHLLENLDQADEEFLRAPGEVRTPDPFQPGEVVSGRFRIEALLGSGGMGQVYRAFDTDLGESIALKVLSLPSSIAPGALLRFRRELQLARRITHPNVGRVFDIGRHHTEAGDIEFFTMELLEGETLAQFLKDNGPCAPEMAQTILGQVLNGLRAAHAAGIVHRDLKPSNIMLVPGPEDTWRAVLMDFGVAHGRISLQEELTRSGDLLGTLAYLSPEALRGNEVTPQTDLFSFGLVWYELLTGSRPYQADSWFGSALERVQRPFVVPEGVAMPPAWRAAIERCLRIEPSERASHDELQELLGAPHMSPPRPVHAAPRGAPNRRRWLIWGTAALVVGVVAVLFSPFFSDVVYKLLHPLPAQRHVALVPFEVVGDAAGLGAGLSESVATQLVRGEKSEPDFWIVPPSELSTQKAFTEEEIRKAFPVTLLVRTAIRRDPRDIRVLTSVVDAQTGATLRSANFLSPTDAIFRLPSLVATEISNLLDVDLESAAQQRPGTNVAEAFRAFESGTTLMLNRDVDSMDKAIDQLGRAIELDPRYADAYAALSRAHSTRFSLTRNVADADLAETNALEAVKRDALVPRVHQTLAMVHFSRGRYGAAITELDRALELDPNDPELFSNLGGAFKAKGQPKDAENAYRKALELRPNYWVPHNLLGNLYLGQGRYGDAAHEFQQVIDVLPTQRMGYSNLGGTHAKTGDCGKAIPLFTKANAIQPGAATYSNLGSCQFQVGKYKDAVASNQAAIGINENDHVAWRNLGDSYRMWPGHDADAVNAYRKALVLTEAALKLNPRDVGAKSGSALYAAKLGDRETSMALIRALDNEPQLDVNIQLRVAIAEEINGNRAAVAPRLRRALQSGLDLNEVLSAWELAAFRASKEWSGLQAEFQKGKK